MGVLQRFERRLEGLVEGAFARVFGGVVQPVEVAAALQREAGDNKQIVGQGRILVPNSFTVEVGETDLERFGEWDAQLRAELAGMVREHAKEQGWSFVGPVEVAFERVEQLQTGVFRVRSRVQADTSDVPARPDTAPRDDHGRSPAPSVPGPGSEASSPPVVVARPRLVVPGSPERVVELTRAVTVVGRGADADLRLPDTGVSRAHAELRRSGDSVRVVDLDSTNGTVVNGQRVRESDLRDGDRLGIGATTLVFRDSDGSDA